jgi:tRNA dimethylallyltransferase
VAAVIVALVGPTAAGKTDLSLDLAERIGGQIVNADAMQLYRGMDVWDIEQSASVAQFQGLARAAVRQIRAEGLIPIVVGGSPLYLRALCDDLAIPPRDPMVRERIARRAEEAGAAAMHAQLAQLDPAAAAQIHPHNVRRVVRALEVIELTGSFTARLPPPTPSRRTLWLGVDRPREDLDERIAARARDMWAGGLLAETEALMRAGLADAPTASRAVGYPQAMSVLMGAAGPNDGEADTVRATRALARRQQRTFRGDPRIFWLPATGQLDAALSAVSAVSAVSEPSAEADAAGGRWERTEAARPDVDQSANGV